MWKTTEPLGMGAHRNLIFILCPDIYSQFLWQDKDSHNLFEPKACQLTEKVDNKTLL